MTSKTSDWRPGPTVCRCCLTEGCYKDISTEYFWMGKREVYAEMLSDTLSVTIGYAKSGPNSNSRLICEPCISRLRDAHDFRRQVLECEKTFMQHLDPGSSSILGDVSLEEVKIERVKQEKKLSDDEDFDDRVDFVVNDDTDDDLDDEPLMKLATKVPKKEKKDKEVDLLELIDSTQITVKRKSTASSSKAKEPPAKKAKKREIVIKPSASKAKASASSTGEKKKKGIITLNDKKESRIIRKFEDFGDARDNAAMLLKFSNMCPFKFHHNKFSCAYCPITSPDFGPIKIHTKEHKDVALAIRKIDSSLECKADVTDLRCGICQENIQTLSTLFEHLIEAHDIPLNRDMKPGIVPYFVENGFECAECGENFDKFRNLNSHMNKHYLRFICSHCGKGFMNELRLKTHVKSVHVKGVKIFRCTKCDEEFTTYENKRKHLAAQHNILAYKCPYCDESFKHFRDRVFHLNDHHGKNITYPCSMCSRVFTYASARRGHFQANHMTHRSFVCSVCGYIFATSGRLKSHMVKHAGEKNYKCEVCEKSFARKKTLTEHMRIHNNDRRFVCVHCGKAFVQKCSLKTHMKHHPDEQSEN